ncbi:hypothetical protein HD554DRAFT_2041389 [Boletus coccyginus]|nr:hypothetical protein HD554DRAFT_2041389 [Boletus coccyginus]
MSPRQRAASFTIGDNFAESLAGQELEASQAWADTVHHFLGKKKFAGACSQCQAHKVKCEIPPGVKGTATNTSALPSKPQVIWDKHHSRGTPTSRSSVPPTSQLKVSTKDKYILENMCRSQKSIAPPLQKYSIIEFDEAYGPITFNEDDEDVDIPTFPTEALRSADQLLSVMTTGTSEVNIILLNLWQLQHPRHCENKKSRPPRKLPPLTMIVVVHLQYCLDSDKAKISLCLDAYPAGISQLTHPRIQSSNLKMLPLLAIVAPLTPAKVAKGSGTTSDAAKQKTTSGCADSELDEASCHLKLVGKLQE